MKQQQSQGPLCLICAGPGARRRRVGAGCSQRVIRYACYFWWNATLPAIP